MQNSLSELLVAEHNVIIGAGELINLNDKLWESNSSEYKNYVINLLNFFSVYADEFHHQKEEEILFPAISSKNNLVGGSIVQELIEHHEDFRQLLQQIRKALAANDFVTTQKYLETYIDKLRDHIGAENDELFPMTEELFSKPELDNLYFKCLDKDRELCLSRKEELENLIKKLKRNEAIK